MESHWKEGRSQRLDHYKSPLCICGPEWEHERRLYNDTSLTSGTVIILYFQRERSMIYSQTLPIMFQFSENAKQDDSFCGEF